ncbi:hypothetical protein SCHPADRAFT_709176 [Schizopora paradoxa]|uniref:Uncharacterized protein n=1 Tax=Schizopora paradoxa TaxID=27342 RepID=A0A0H2R272_9AGAM|nr:hypothetical protein SCHPADRAFT_709176 [Schizopora paradoxa]
MLRETMEILASTGGCTFRWPMNNKNENSLGFRMAMDVVTSIIGDCPWPSNLIQLLVHLGGTPPPKASVELQDIMDEFSKIVRYATSRWKLSHYDMRLGSLAVVWTLSMSLTDPRAEVLVLESWQNPISNSDLERISLSSRRRFQDLNKAP